MKLPPRASTDSCTRHAVRRNQAHRQRDAYAALCHHLTGTLLPLDGDALALR